MQVINKKELIKETEGIICSKCNTNATDLRDDSYRTYNNWRNINERTTCSAEEFVICPSCGMKIVLAVWTEEF